MSDRIRLLVACSVLVAGCDSPLLHDLPSQTALPDNQPPVPGADTLAGVLEDHALTLSSAQLRTSLLGNDHDVDGDTLTVSAVLAPEHGAVALTGGIVTFTPAVDYFGPAGFSYRVDDGRGLSSTGAVTFNVTAVNDAPSFTAGAAQTARNDAGPQSVPGWATGMSAGPPNESAQILSFMVVALDTSLFSAQPAVSANGTLTYTPAPGAMGSSSVQVRIHDDGGAGNGGVDTSAVQSFTITITPPASVAVADTLADSPEDAPIVLTSADVSTLLLGNDVAAQGLTLTVTAVKSPLHGTVVLSAGMITFMPAPDYSGGAGFTYVMDDGTTSSEATVSFNVLPVDDAPSFTKGTDVAVLEDSGPHSSSGWASGMGSGPSNESGQTLSFLVTANEPTLFSVQPAVAVDGTLTFTPAANAFGSTQVSVRVHDDGGTVNGGIDTSAAQTFTIDITPVNDPPAFARGADQAVNEDSGPRSVTGWATGIGAGPANEAAQTLTFSVMNNTNAALFSTAPALSSTGTLTFTPAANAHGTATISIRLTDNGGSSSGGNDSSATQAFTITVNAVNDAPSFTKGADQTVLEDSTAKVVAGWATGISPGPADENGQTLTFTATASDTTLFSAQPVISAAGTLTFTPAANASGSTTITVHLVDSGGTANGGSNTSGDQTFTINVTGINDAPYFTKGGDPTVNEDAGAVTLAGWATGISAGAANESPQTLTFTVTATTPALFSAQPQVSSTGTLTFTPAPNTFGSSSVSIYLGDNGGTASGGADRSATQTFTIHVNSVNDAPSFVKGGDQTVAEDTGPHTVNAWATAISPGPSNESTQTVSFIVTPTNTALFSAGPSIDASGNLTYTAAANAFGTTTVSVEAHDDGGVANGGTDTGAAQTLTITITNVNDAPVLSGINDFTGYVLGQATNHGDLVSGLLTGVASDADGDLLGMAVIAADNTNGAWEWSSDTGTTWHPIGAVTNTSALVLGAAVLVRFVPNAGFHDADATITARAWDGTDGHLSGDTGVAIGTPTAISAYGSATAISTIHVASAVNTAPGFTKGANQAVLEDAGAQTLSGWATNLQKGATSADDWQTLSFLVSNDNNTLFQVQPAISSTGTLTFTPAANANGSTTVTVRIHDNGGTALSGVDTSAAQTFTITVTAVNDAPSFTKGSNQAVLEDAGAQTVAGWATAPSAGPTNESAQTLNFVVSNSNSGLFATPPAVSATGTLTYTPAPNANGSATVTISIHDGGGIANGGADTSATQTFTITVTAVNDAPSFTRGSNQAVLEDVGARTVAGWATALSVGPSDESSQAVNFIVSNDNNGLFSTPPAVSATGTLTYTPAPDVNGSATVTVSIHDDGGTASGGADTSATQTFTITVTAVNDSPSFTKGSNQTVLEDAGAQTVAGWATAISAGPADETGQALSFTVINNNSGLFAVEPVVSAAGALTYTPAANASGTATITVSIHDDGGTASGGADTSATQTFTIAVTAVNDAPSFTKGADETILEDAGPRSVAGWATGISDGPNETGQGLDFVVSNNNSGLFSTPPAVSAAGTLTYTPAPNTNGSATITISIHDGGGIANGGADTSAAQTFTISVTAVNDAPSFTAGPAPTFDEDSGAHTIAGWATNPSAGPADESTQTLSFVITNNTNAALFAVAPSLSDAGDLSFTAAADASGSATLTLHVHDTGGSANGGVPDGTDQTVVITINSVNDAPSFTKGVDPSFDEDSGAHTLAGWATSLSAGPADESTQALSFVVTNNTNPALFAAAPAVSDAGDLSFTAAANAHGSATLTLHIHDSGGAANGGVPDGADQTVVVTLNAVNDAPSFTKGDDQIVDESASAQPVAVANWATGMSAGPNETGQTLTFNVANDNHALFSAQPSVSAAGALTFTVAANAIGSATVTLNLRDDGGTASGGADTSADQTFTVAVNTPPDSSISTSATTITAGGSVSFTGGCTDDNAGGTSHTYLWTFGGNTPATSTALSPTVPFPSPGIYTVTFTCTDARLVPDPTPASVTVIVRRPQPLVVSSARRTCAIDRDHRLYCAGFNGYPDVGVLGIPSFGAFATGTLTRVGSAADWKTVSMGAFGTHTCAVNYAGELWCWGTNDQGQVGDGTTGFHNEPVRVGASVTNWRSVSAGLAHTCAITDTNALYCWGIDTEGELGQGAPTGAAFTPTPVAGTWSSVSAGSANTCAITPANALYCWGGATASGTGVEQDSPYPISGTWTHVSVGTGYACAVAASGSLYCWGSGGPATPTVIGSDTTWTRTAVAGYPTGPYHICGLNGGALYCWGDNTRGALGDQSVAAQASPHQVGSATTWVDVTADAASTCGVHADASVECWGDNGYGQLGLGSTGHKLQPTQVGALTTWTKVATDGTVSCAIRGGHLLCAGRNTYSNLGLNGAAIAPAFTDLGTGTVPATGWSDVDMFFSADSITSTHSCAINSGDVWCWGRGAGGVLGDGDASSHTLVVPTLMTSVHKWTRVAVGGFHTCGITDAGALYCWGKNDQGQLGDGSGVDSVTPVQEAGLRTSWTWVGAGIAHTCAVSVVATVATVWCFGDNSSWQVGDADALHTDVLQPKQVVLATSPTQLTVGAALACVVNGANELWCWGTSAAGATGGGATTPDKASPTQLAGTWSAVFSRAATTFAVDLTTGNLHRTGAYPLPDQGESAATYATSFTAFDSTVAWGSVAAGFGSNVIGLSTAMSLWVWGLNGDGQLGDGTGLYLTPQAVTVP